MDFWILSRFSKMENPHRKFDGEINSVCFYRLWAGRCVFDCYSNPCENALLTDCACRLINRLALLIHTILADSCNPPADNMCHIIVRTEGGGHDKFLFRDILGETSSLARGDIFNRYLISFILAQCADRRKLE